MPPDDPPPLPPSSPPPGDDDSLRLEDGSDIWEQLTEYLDGFVDAWEAGPEPPSLVNHLPAGPSALRRLTLVELVKLDLEFRHQSSDAEPLRVETYVEQFPELETDGLPVDLIYEEYHIRRQAGDDPQADEYYRRFPQHREELQRLLPLNSPTVSVSLQSKQKRPSLEAGERIDDFHLLKQLGVGAFGQVFLAQQQSLQRLVAVKISADRGAETQTLAQLEHPNIVAVYDQRRMESRNWRLMYMQYAAGGTLQGVVRLARNQAAQERSGKLISDAVRMSVEGSGGYTTVDGESLRRLEDLSWPEAICRLGQQLAEALEHAHVKQVLHRDIKPANVLLSASGEAKLADFNISYSGQSDGASPAAYFGGSLAYMSPEQLDACNPGRPGSPEDLDGRSDIFSLGVLLWELLEGERPFGDERVGDNWVASLKTLADERRKYRKPVEPSGLDPVELALRGVLRRCLDPDPQERYATGGALARDLGLCQEPRALQLLKPPPGGFRQLLFRWPWVALALAAIIPNAIAGVFNFAYNEGAIIQRLQGSELAFFRIQLVINGIAFPLGVVLVLSYAWPVLRLLRRDEPPPDADTALAARQRALQLGSFIALVGISEWALAGLAYPLSLHAVLGELDPSLYGHFFLSLLICGLIAAAYPFILASLLAVRIFLPALLRGEAPTPRDAEALQALDRQTELFLYGAGGVPAAGVAAILVLGPTNNFALLALSIVGAVGYAFVQLAHRALRRDLAALVKAAR